MVDPFEVAVLGPTLVTGAGRPVAVDRPLERALLVRLVLARGTPVPDERVAADLWGDVELHRATQRLRVVASRLRGTLGEHAGVVGRTPAGYRAAVGPSDLAAAEAAASRMHDAARAGDHAGVRDAATAALACWRGPALADLRGMPFALPEGERLDGWWLELTVRRLDAELSLGAGGEIVVELTGLAGEHPLHEPIACLLAHALYRAGRQADALDRLARLRRALADELGVDPSAATADLEMRILRQDPALLAPRAPAPVEATRSPQLLPAPGTSFVGRDAELAALVETLSAPGIVTLVGGPGSGKSRLAIEAARAVEGRAVALVELAPLRPGDVAPAIADAAGAEPGAGGDPLQAAAAALDGSVLLLDNAEHVVDEASAAAHALRLAAPGLTMLVTSQRPLLLAGETQVQVGPLAPAAAAALFAQRAAPDAVPGDGSAAGYDGGDVATICAAVDHLPLGVELAAGLTRALTVAQIARRITDRVRLLVGGRRDIGGRHTSLRAALDWSHELLGERERAVLRRLGVFAGGCDLDAAERVAPDGAVEGCAVEVGDVAPALTDLVDRSLLGVVGTPEGRRFVLLESVRDYALGRLAAAGEAEPARARHLAWCRDHVARLQEVDDFATAGTVAAVYAEWPNIAEALETAPGSPRAADALRLANAMQSAWIARGRAMAARHHFAALADADGADAAERGLAMSNHAFHAIMAGLHGEALALLTTASELAAASGDDELALSVHYHRGILATQLCRQDEAIATLQAGRELARANDDQREWVFTDTLGTAYLFSGDVDAALECYRTSVAHDRARGSEHGLARGLANLANAELDAGRADEAVRLADESDAFAHRLEDTFVLPMNEVVRGIAARREGRLADAEKHCRAAVAHADGLPSMAHTDLADVLVEKGELDEAAALLDVVLAESAEGELAWLAARSVSCALAVAAGDPAAPELVERTAAQQAAAGFGWRRYTERLREVAARL